MIDPALVAVIVKYGADLLKRLLEAGWTPTADDLELIREQRKQAVKDWDAAGED